jgi:hypothetical protein
MNVFISWSGETGREIAEVLHRWLPSVIQAVKTYLSPHEVNPGARWSSEIALELETSNVGLIVVTRESVQAPWIMFEAGALSKHIGRGKVAPILFGIDPADIKGPLAQFQAATFQKQEFKRVLRMINSELRDSALTSDRLDAFYELRWPSLADYIEKLLRRTGRQKTTTHRSDRELLEELLALTRSSSQREAERRDTLEYGELTAARRPRTVAGREREPQLSPHEIKARMNSGGNLAGANLMGVDLTAFDLSGGNLRGANLVAANLTAASLVNADLTGANLERASLRNADLKGANISRANLWRAAMTGVKNLDSVSSMEFANFYEVDGLSVEDRRAVSGHKTLSLRDYGVFFEFYRAQGMSRSELSEVFLWTAHPHFASILPL